MAILIHAYENWKHITLAVSGHNPVDRFSPGHNPPWRNRAPVSVSTPILKANKRSVVVTSTYSTYMHGVAG